MTEIRVEQKKRRSPWPWLLLLALPILWFALRGRGDGNDITLRDGVAPDSTALISGDAAGDVARSGAAVPPGEVRSGGRASTGAPGSGAAARALPQPVVTDSVADTTRTAPPRDTTRPDTIPPPLRR